MSARSGSDLNAKRKNQAKLLEDFQNSRNQNFQQYHQSQPDLSEGVPKSVQTAKSMPTTQLRKKYQAQLEKREASYRRIPSGNSEQRFQSFSVQPSEEEMPIDEEVVVPVQQQQQANLQNSSLFKISDTDVQQKFAQELEKSPVKVNPPGEMAPVQFLSDEKEVLEEAKNPELDQDLPSYGEDEDFEPQESGPEPPLEKANSQQADEVAEPVQEEIAPENNFIEPGQEIDPAVEENSNDVKKIKIVPEEEPPERPVDEQVIIEIPNSVDERPVEEERQKESVHEIEELDSEMQGKNELLEQRVYPEEIKEEEKNVSGPKSTDTEILVQAVLGNNFLGESGQKNFSGTHALENLKEVSSSFQSEKSGKHESEQQEVEAQSEKQSKPHQETNLTSFHIDYTSQRVIMEKNESNSSSEIYNDRSFRMTQKSVQKKLSQELWVDADEMARSELARSINRTKLYRFACEYEELIWKVVARELSQLRKVQQFVWNKGIAIQRQVLGVLRDYQVKQLERQAKEVKVRKTLFKKEQLIKNAVYRVIREEYEQRKKLTGQILKSFKVYRVKRVFYELKMFVYEVQAERQMRLYLQGVLLRAMKKVVEEASFGRDAKALSHFYYRIVGKSFLRWRRIVRVKKRVAIKYRKARLAIERMKKAFLMSKLRQFVVFMRREKERGLQNYDPNQFIDVKLNLALLNRKRQ